MNVSPFQERKRDRHLAHMPIGTVENRDLQCVTINGSRTIELEQFTGWKVDLHVLSGQQRLGVGTKRQAARNVGGGDLNAFPSRID